MHRVSTSLLETPPIPEHAGWDLADHHPAAPGQQVSLGGHLAAGGVVVHLPDSLHLPAPPEAHVGWGWENPSALGRCTWGKKKKKIVLQGRRHV